MFFFIAELCKRKWIVFVECLIYCSFWCGERRGSFSFVSSSASLSSVMARSCLMFSVVVEIPPAARLRKCSASACPVCSTSNEKCERGLVSNVLGASNSRIWPLPSTFEEQTIMRDRERKRKEMDEIPKYDRYQSLFVNDVQWWAQCNRGIFLGWFVELIHRS